MATLEIKLWWGKPTFFMTIINGKTKLLGVIGDPVGHTLSPLMHNA
ncbi:MAG: shikimate dehydrogenase, partial [Microcystis panniformis]